MDSIALTYCNDYNISKIEDLLRKASQQLNLDISDRFSGKKVLLKPNLLGAHHPDRAVTTHPSVVEAAIRMLKDYDCEIWLGDSPNGVQKSLEDVWQKTGMDNVCEKYGVRKKYFEREGATLIDDLLISNVVLEADYVINVPKFKTHGLTILTCAVKNMFGIVPGLKKTDYHRKSGSKEKFGEVLVRIAETKKPCLNIVDGIEGMAGNGPSGGFKINTNFIAVGRDMHGIDLAFANLIGVDPLHVDTLMAAEKRGLINLAERPPLLTDDLSKFDFGGFKLPTTYTGNLAASKIFRFLISKTMSSMRVKPRVTKEKCIKCGMCVRICPVSVIRFQKDGYPRVDTSGCIECYCCHEACPEKAMELKESLILKAVKKISDTNSKR